MIINLTSKNNLIVKIILFLILTPSSLAYSKSTTGLIFEYEDWQLVCDNTRTCRAAGYQRDDSDDLPLSITLTRNAGPRQKVNGLIDLGSPDGDESLPDRFQAAVLVNGNLIFDISVIETRSTLIEHQTEKLIKSLKHSGKIEIISGSHKWTLSNEGAIAVFLKMDKFQRRVNTTGAIINKGLQNESKVILPLPAPVIYAVKVPTQKIEDNNFAKINHKLLISSLNKSLKNNICDELRTKSEDGPVLDSYRLSDNKFLISTVCWSGAYNVGYGFWIVNSSPPFKAILVTNSGTDYDNGYIWATHRGRGLGDCWYIDGWTWDGKKFIHTEKTEAGMCKGIAGGNLLPRIVTEIRYVKE